MLIKKNLLIKGEKPVFNWTIYHFHYIFFTKHLVLTFYEIQYVFHIQQKNYIFMNWQKNNDRMREINYFFENISSENALEGLIFYLHFIYMWLLLSFYCFTLFAALFYVSSCQKYLCWFLRPWFWNTRANKCKPIERYFQYKWML